MEGSKGGLYSSEIHHENIDFIFCASTELLDPPLDLGF